MTTSPWSDPSRYGPADEELRRTTEAQALLDAITPTPKQTELLTSLTEKHAGDLIAEIAGADRKLLSGPRSMMTFPGICMKFGQVIGYGASIVSPKWAHDHLLQACQDAFRIGLEKGHEQFHREEGNDK